MACTLHISNFRFTCILVWRLLSLTFMSQPQPAPITSSLLSLHRMEAIEGLPVHQIWSWEIVVAGWSIQTTRTFSISRISLICSLIILVLPGLALFISLKFLTLTTCLNWCNRADFQPVCFDISFTLSLIICWFWLKVRDMWLFSGTHFNANFNIVIFLGIKRPKEIENNLSVGRENTYLLSSASFMGAANVTLNQFQ